MLDLDALSCLDEALPDAPVDASPAPAPEMAEPQHICPHLAKADD